MNTYKRKPGFTIIEVLVVVSIIGLLLGIMLPALGRARDTALQSVSLSNLRQISAGLAAYAGDWNDRQPTLIPDDFCQADGASPKERCNDYINTIHCMPQPILGWANINEQRSLWGYYIDNGSCNTPGIVDNIEVAMPYSPSEKSGYFRILNHKLFAQYMNDRYYDEVFFAPKDRRKLEKVEEFFDLPDEFSSDDLGGIIEWPSYCMAASAMIAPDAASGKYCDGGGGSTNDMPDRMCNPCDFPGGFRSPSVGAAAYPDLKMRCWEHEWLQNNPAELNPAFTTETPYYFNHSPQSAPVSLMFDGSVRIFSANEAILSNDRLARQLDRSGTTYQDGVGDRRPGLLWMRDWTGEDYFEAGSHGFEEEWTSFGVLTRGGIKGRDTIGME